GDHRREFPVPQHLRQRRGPNGPGLPLHCPVGRGGPSDGDLAGRARTDREQRPRSVRGPAGRRLVEAWRAAWVGVLGRTGGRITVTSGRASAGATTSFSWTP